VVEHLVEHRLLYLVDDVRVVAGELATNAVVAHAQTDFTVILEERESSVLLTVRDGPPVPPASSVPASDGTNIVGRGLVILNLMSDMWGVAGQGGTANSVWAAFEKRSRAVS
jgi:anti-sigma regulatory factor (Ser/Thr protein kinase)